jgi:NAD(P)-dependent dehydrogenase (short-subunit alcohol dehydrogenase family)
MSDAGGVLLLGSPTAPVASLAAALGTEVTPLPSPEEEAPAAAVVVAVWSEAVAEPAGLATLGLDEWMARAEEPLARWFTALGVAARRCADGGAIVAVVEKPAPLDCAGWAAEAGVADAVEAMVRSLARSEGGRGVRVNAVTTPTRLVPATVVDPAPSLASFPGTVADEVAGAVRLLLSADAGGVTGTVVNADCGRSWR